MNLTTSGKMLVACLGLCVVSTLASLHSARVASRTEAIVAEVNRKVAIAGDSVYQTKEMIGRITNEIAVVKQVSGKTDTTNPENEKISSRLTRLNNGLADLSDNIKEMNLLVNQIHLQIMGSTKEIYYVNGSSMRRMIENFSSEINNMNEQVDVVKKEIVGVRLWGQRSIREMVDTIYKEVSQ